MGKVSRAEGHGDNTNLKRNVGGETHHLKSGECTCGCLQYIHTRWTEEGTDLTSGNTQGIESENGINTVQFGVG